MNESELAFLCCRGKYRIKWISTIFNDSDWKNELFQMFRGLVSAFMRMELQWNYFKKAGKECLDSKGLTLKALKGIESGARANCLALYGLCLVCDVHCFVHLKDGGYWSSLYDDPQDHDIYLE